MLCTVPEMNLKKHRHTFKATYLGLPLLSKANHLKLASQPLLTARKIRLCSIEKNIHHLLKSLERLPVNTITRPGSVNRPFD